MIQLSYYQYFNLISKIINRLTINLLLFITIIKQIGIYNTLIQSLFI